MNIELVKRVGHRAMIGVISLVVALVAVTTLLSCFGRFAWPLDLLSFGRQHLFLTAIVLAALTLAVGCRRWALLAIAAAVTNGLLLFPMTGAGTAPAVAAIPDQALRVVTLNVLVDNHRSRPAVNFLRTSGADIIAVQEVTTWWAGKLAALRDLYPYMTPADDSTNLVLSRFPILSAESLQPPPGGLVSDLDRPIRVVIAVGDHQIAVYAVHPPTPRSMQQWTTRNSQIVWLGHFSRSMDGDRPRIMLGDFNTPPWSFLFAELLTAAQLRDAGGGGFRQPTRQPMLVEPHLAWLGAPVDHVLVSPEIAVTSYSVGRSVLSDHLPVIADLRLRGRQSSGVSPAR